MKKLFTLFFVTLWVQVYTQTYQWATASGTSGTISASNYGIYVDVSGNVYSTGVFQNHAVFLNQNSSGNPFWLSQLGGSGYSNGRAIAIDALGNTYVVGDFKGTISNGTISITAYGPVGMYSDVFLTKINSTGNILWTKRVGGGTNDYSNSIKVDASGNVYYSGYFEGVVDFDPGATTYTLSSTLSREGFISKLDANGNFIWVIKNGFSSNFIDIDNSGNIISTGVFAGTTDFDPTVVTYNLVASGGYDVFISKFNNSGNLIWAKKIGGANSETGKALSIDGMNDVYSVGTFSGSCDFDPGTTQFILTASGNLDVYILKLDQNGNFIWAKKIGNSNADEVNSVIVDVGSNVYYTGSFFGTTDFDPNTGVNNLISSGGSNDIYFSKLDGNGNFLWAKGVGGNLSDIGNSVDVSSSAVYIAGSFQGLVDFNPPFTANLNCLGYADGFVAKYNTITTEIDASILTGKVNIHPNPATNILNIVNENIENIDLVIVLDITGRKIFSQTDNTSQINIQFLEQGLYQLILASDGKWYTNKFIKE